MKTHKQKFQNVFRQLNSFAFVASTIFQVSTEKKINRKTKRSESYLINYMTKKGHRID